MSALQLQYSGSDLESLDSGNSLETQCAIEQLKVSRAQTALDKVAVLLETFDKIQAGRFPPPFMYTP